LEAKVPFLKSLRLDGILSFPPDSEPIPLEPLNVLIGPNGSGKSNLIEGIELLHATTTGFASAIREGGGVREWLWKGDNNTQSGLIDAQVDLTPRLRDSHSPDTIDIDLPHDLHYGIAFTALGQQVEIYDEFIENVSSRHSGSIDGRIYYYRTLNGKGEVSIFTSDTGETRLNTTKSDKRFLDLHKFKPGESVLSQLKDPVSYPELTELGRQFGQIQTFREWSFGRDTEVRRPQPTDLAADVLTSDSRNLGMLLNQLEYLGASSEFHRYLSRFLPRFERFSTRVEGGTIQFYLHESGLKQPVPATRLSDGTIRFMAILAQLLSPTPPPLICMEEPELGLHPDAIALLAGLLQEASARTQLIVTTHSDAMISALTEVADSVLVCEYRGGTVLKRIESEKLRFWLEKYKLGEIWRIGEIGGNL
jgi:predicted ATPase